MLAVACPFGPFIARDKARQNRILREGKSTIGLAKRARDAGFRCFKRSTRYLQRMED